MTADFDVHLGRRLRSRRRMVGLTQEQLAHEMGLRFQTIAKYEAATTRMSAARIYELSRALSVPVTYFFDGLPPERNMH